MTVERPTLAILAGGRGTRMGTPKAWLQPGGRPILEFLLERLAWTGPTLLVTAPGLEHPPGWKRFDFLAVDPVGGQGPLRGLHTALTHASTAITLVSTVDMPAIEPRALHWLAAELAATPHVQGMLLRRWLGASKMIEPFPCVFRSSAAESIARRLHGARLSVHSLADEPDCAILDAPLDWPATNWTNLNTPGELAEFEKALGKKSGAL